METTMVYTTVKQIFNEKKELYSASYEYSLVDVTLVKDSQDNYYMRVYRKSCTAEGNGRPVTYISDYCYPLEDETKISANNWKINEILLDGIELENISYEGV